MKLTSLLHRPLVGLAAAGLTALAATACGTTVYQANGPASPSAAQAIDGTATARGATDLVLSGHSLRLSSDNGSTWDNVALPSAVPGAASVTSAAESGGYVVLTAVRGTTEDVLRHGLGEAGSWSVTSLPAPDFPAFIRPRIAQVPDRHHAWRRIHRDDRRGLGPAARYQCGAVVPVDRFRRDLHARWPHPTRNSPSWTSRGGALPSVHRRMASLSWGQRRATSCTPLTAGQVGVA